MGPFDHGTRSDPGAAGDGCIFNDCRLTIGPLFVSRPGSSREGVERELLFALKEFKIGFKIAYVAELNIELESVESAGRHAVVTIASQFFDADSNTSDPATPYPEAPPDKSYSPLILFHV